MASKGYFELLGMIHVYGIDDKRVQAKGKQLFKGKPGSKAKEYYVFDEQDNYIMTGTTKEITARYGLAGATVRRHNKGGYLRYGPFKDWYIIGVDEYKEKGIYTG